MSNYVDDLLSEAHRLFKAGDSLSVVGNKLFEYSESKGYQQPIGDCYMVAATAWESHKRHNCHNQYQVSQPIQQCHNLSQPMSQLVTTWACDQPGKFTTKDLYLDLGLKDKSEKAAARQVLKRLVDSGEITTVHGHRGAYRTIDRSEDMEMDLLGANDAPFPYAMPLDLHKIVEVNEKDIIIIGGEPNTGKTAWAFWFVYASIGMIHANRYTKYIYKSKNKKEEKEEEKERHTKFITYMSSEAGPSETRKRVLRYGDSSPVGGTPVLNAFSDNVRFIERNCNYSDHINPNGINVIDFLEVFDGEYYKIGSMITEIHSAMKSGISLICIQKNHGSQFAEGGSKSLQKPRLFVTLSNDPQERGFFTAKILKAKHFTGINPNGMERDYVIQDGVFIRPLGPWAYRKNLENDRNTKDYTRNNYVGDVIRL